MNSSDNDFGHRFYSFVNMYLSPMAKGIQTAHCVAEMANTYAIETDNDMYREWAMRDKTIIVLDGGYYSNMLEIRALLDRIQYPSSDFFESEEAMNGMLTCVGIILPYRIWGAVKELKNGGIVFEDTTKSIMALPTQTGTGTFEYSDDDIELIKLLSNTDLAR